MPGFWAWYLPPSEDAAGWSPHRDRLQKALDDDNSPHVLTIWLALSDATPIASRSLSTARHRASESALSRASVCPPVPSVPST